MAAKTGVAQSSREAVQPQGSRPPNPDLLPGVLRGSVWLCIGLIFGHGALVAWLTPLVGGTNSVIVMQPERLAGLAILAVVTTLVPGVYLVGGAGSVLVVSEIVAVLYLQRLQVRRQARVPVSYMLVRIPAPLQTVATRGGVAGTVPTSGDQFYRAIYKGFLGRWRDRVFGNAPWVALTLHGRPEEPIDFGVVVAHRDAVARRTVMQSLRDVIQGQAPGAQVDERPCPLSPTLTPGATVLWRSFVLALPPQYPLRALQDIAGSDLLAPLAAALVPRGVVATEAQISIRPSHGMALNSNWRGRATRMLLLLQSKAMYGLSPDTASLEAKLDSMPFEVGVRVVVVATGTDAPAQCQETMDRISMVIGQYSERTGERLQYLKPGQTEAFSVSDASGTGDLPARVESVLRRTPPFAALPRLLIPRWWFEANVLTACEVAGLWHLPTPTLASVARWLPCKFIPAPPHAFIGNGKDPAARIAFGHARRADGSLALVGPTLRDLRQPAHFTAGMGTGKSRLLCNIGKQLIPFGFTLFDGKGDDAGNLTMTLREHIPLADERRVIIFDPLDVDWPIGINPMAGVDRLAADGIDIQMAQLMAVFARLDPATWSKSQGMQQYVSMAAGLVLEAVDYPTFAHVKQVLVDDGYMQSLLPRCTNPDIMTFWTVIYPRTGEQQKQSRDALLRRFDAILAKELTRYLMTQPKPTIDFLDVIEQGDIFLMPMPHNRLQDLAGIVGMILFQAVIRAANSRAGNDQTRSTYPLLIDELQVFVGEGENKDLQNAITQLRSRGIAGLYAHQALKQIGDLVDEMLISCGTRVMLRTKDPDASTYAGQYAAKGLTAADISGQDPNEHQYADLTCDGVPTDVFSMSTLPWPAPVEIEVDPYAGMPWQHVLPPDAPNAREDTALCALVYGRHDDFQHVVDTLVGQDERSWNAMNTRWDALRAFHRDYILHNPGCIPDRFERQLWLSRLRAARPRILAAIEYARTRRAFGAEAQVAPGAGRSGPHTGREGRSETGAAPAAARSIPGARDQFMPVGSVDVGDTPESAQVLRERGSRRSARDVGAAFDLPDTKGQA